MRALVAIAVFILGLAGATGAAAADLPSVRGVIEYGGYADYGRRAGSIIIVDNEPGVRVRAYWRAPWRNRHYFPTTDGKPDAVRDDDAGGAPEPAETFQRFWSTSSAFRSDLPRRDLPDPPLK